jgi:Predicted glycosyltransferases
MIVSAVIPNINGTDLLNRYLPSITECVQGWGEAVVVDDASTDGSVDFVRSRFPGIKIIARAHNGGFSAAINDGIRATDSEFVLVLNNDVEVGTELEFVIMVIAVSCVKLLSAHNSTQHTSRKHKV